MTDSGLYTIFLSLSRETKIRVGKMGVLNFEKGAYIYIGSAKRNLPQRIARHKRRKKKLHWHIDYLRKRCGWEGFVVYTDVVDECTLATMVEGAVNGSRPHAKFGASDCGCKGHLIFAGTKASFQDITPAF